ncbi:peptidoglycan-associated lipoprotein Pal [Candidatus Binatus sp.]|uniref:peptidoglycan-associated lipoprotein Pal n=1 Tax=Candidatus Binatus sp. TaxID=2811406 RepID=UPI00272D7817|nr:peptidoglycan-associated lipoprotein Pal [Candidatus Binatus sp.]
MSSSSNLAGAIALISLGVVLALAGCSSKKTQGVGDLSSANPAGMGETGSGKSSLEQMQQGSLGQGQSGPLTDIHFGYNEYTIEPQDGSILKGNASWLQKNSSSRVQVEGHCDDRGSEEYNIALGAKRAQAAKDYLVTLGIPGSRISTISYGKELPLCTEHDESCWAQNRRDHFVVNQ